MTWYLWLIFAVITLDLLLVVASVIFARRRDYWAELARKDRAR